MSFLAELKRRNVIRVGAAYVVSSWLVAQVVELGSDAFGAPEWVMQVLLLLLIIGFPVTLIFAWIYELTPEGVKLEKDVDRSQSETANTGQRLNRGIVTLLVLAVVVLLLDKFYLSSSVDQTGTASNSVASTTAESDRSVAVLPFVNLSGDETQVLFADGLTEELLNRLAHIPQLLVTARTSSFQFRDTELGIPAIAEKLGVAHIVEGSIRRSGDRLRVTVQLIRAADGFHLWSENYDRTLDDLFAVQDDIAQQVAASLDVFLDEDRRKLIQSSGTRNVAAFELFTQAAGPFAAYHTSDDRSGLYRANKLLEKAIQLDPEFGSAYSLHADLYTHFLFNDEARQEGNHPPGLTEAQAYETLQSDMRKAEEASATPYARLLARLDRTYVSTDWSDMPVIFSQMETLLSDARNEASSNQWAEVALSLLGRIDEALEFTRSNLRHDPLSAGAYSGLAGVLIHRGDYEQALTTMRRGRELTGVHASLLWIDIAVAIRHDDAATAEAVLESAPASKEFMAYRVWSAARLGDCNLARERKRQLNELQNGADDFLGVWVDYWLGDLTAANNQLARLDESPLAAAQFANWAWSLGNDTPWGPDLMPRIAAQFKSAGVLLKKVENFFPLCSP